MSFSNRYGLSMKHGLILSYFFKQIFSKLWGMVPLSFNLIFISPIGLFPMNVRGRSLMKRVIAIREDLKGALSFQALK